MYPPATPEHAAALAALEKAHAFIMKEENNAYNDLYCIFQEERHTAMKPEDRNRFSPALLETGVRGRHPPAHPCANFHQPGRVCRGDEISEAVDMADMKVRAAHDMKIQVPARAEPERRGRRAGDGKTGRMAGTKCPATHLSLFRHGRQRGPAAAGGPTGQKSRRHQWHRNKMKLLPNQRGGFRQRAASLMPKLFCGALPRRRYDRKALVGAHESGFSYDL